MVEGFELSFVTYRDQLTAVATILLTAGVTYGLRLGGLLLSERLPNGPTLKSFMNALPGAVLVSLISPGILKEGIWGVVSAAGIVVVYKWTSNLFLAMTIGVVIVALARSSL